MDIVTHGLASLAVARGFFPRASKAAMAAAVLAGCAADVDWLSQYFRPATFLAWRGTYAHSLFGIFFFLAVIPSVPIARYYLVPGSRRVDSRHAAARFWAVALGASFCAALLHIAMDACESNGVALFWPFSPKRFAADWLPSIDPWILTILIACIALPELLHLVGSEIGAKAKKPRGQTGAIIGLVLALVYVGARATLHSNVLALMESRTFHTETPRRASAFPETLALLTWHGIVETESALNEIDVNAAAPDTFDPESSLRLFKPEPSPALDAARSTVAAKRFLAIAQIPKASLEKTEAGYVVVLRDLRYAVAGETQNEIAAIIEVDANNKVTSQELVWARDLHR